MNGQDQGAIWDRVLPLAIVIALVEGVVLGYAFSAFSGAGFVLQYWALVAIIVSGISIVGAILAERVARLRLSRSTAAHLGLITGPILGLVAGYLLQPRAGPV